MTADLVERNPWRTVLYADRTEDCKNLRRRIIKQLVIKAEYMWMTDPQIAFGCNEGICL